VILYGAIAAGIIIAALSGAVWVQSERLDVAQGTLKNCQDSNALLVGSVNKQNKAVKDLAKESDKRLKRAADARKRAEEGQGKADSEIARLKAAKPADCAAAVATVKEGMRK